MQNRTYPRAGHRETLTDAQLKDVGLSSHRPYTVDMLPSMGPSFARQPGDIRQLARAVESLSELHDLNIFSGEAGGIPGMRLLESRVRLLHPGLENIQFTNRWGGLILIAEEMKPVFKAI